MFAVVPPMPTFLAFLSYSLTTVSSNLQLGLPRNTSLSSLLLRPFTYLITLWDNSNKHSCHERVEMNTHPDPGVPVPPSVADLPRDIGPCSTKEIKAVTWLPGQSQIRKHSWLKFLIPCCAQPLSIFRFSPKRRAEVLRLNLELWVEHNTFFLLPTARLLRGCSLCCHHQDLKHHYRGGGLNSPSCSALWFLC